jgi:hypothetical protein
LDDANDGIGFSSFVGPNGFEPAYPFGLDGGASLCLLDAYCTGGKANLALVANYSGKIYSCIGFHPGSYTCADPTKYPLKTDRGDFAIFMPYYNQTAGGMLDSHYSSGSLNVGTFSVFPRERKDK